MPNSKDIILFINLLPSGLEILAGCVNVALTAFELRLIRFTRHSALVTPRVFLSKYLVTNA